MGLPAFTYRATDPGGLYDEATVTIAISEVNDAPAFAADTAVRSVSESARPGDNVGPPDRGQRTSTTIYSRIGSRALRGSR